MSYESCVLSGLFVVRWEQPQVGDPTRYCNELSEAARRQGKPLVGLFIMPASSTPPDDTFKREQARSLPTIMTHLTYAMAVFEGTGFAASLKRSALTAIILLSGQRQRIHVRSSVVEALRDPPGPLPFDANQALARLRLRGLCESDQPESRPAAPPRP